MASTNPTSARLSRSTSDLSGVKRQRTPETSSRVADGGKGTLPRAKIRALEQFVKFGRQGKQKEAGKSNQKAADFPPPSWFESRSVSTTSPPPVAVGADSAPKTMARGLPPPRSPPQLPPRTGPTTGSEPRRTAPDISPSTSRRAVTAQTGLDFSHTTGTAPAAPGINPSPTLHRRGSSFPGPGALDGDSEDVTPPEPVTLARRIQTLLSPWSASQAPTATPSATDATTSSGAPQSEAAGPATPDGSIPPGPVPITDSRFLSFLRNENVMGGSLDKGRQSVFAILDRLRRPSGYATETPAGSAPSSVSEREYDDDDDDGDSSIMLYGPLVPSEDSEVELAASDVMSLFDDGETLEFERPARPLSFAEAEEQFTPRSTPTPLPSESSQQQGPADARQPDSREEPGTTGWFDTWKGKVIEGGKLVSDKVAEGTMSLKDKVVEGRKVVKTRTRWVPSPDKISFQASWWGYRLCVYVSTFVRIAGLTSCSMSGISLRLCWMY